MKCRGAVHANWWHPAIKKARYLTPSKLRVNLLTYSFTAQVFVLCLLHTAALITCLQYHSTRLFPALLWPRNPNNQPPQPRTQMQTQTQACPTPLHYHYPPIQQILLLPSSRLTNANPKKHNTSYTHTPSENQPGPICTSASPYPTSPSSHLLPLPLLLPPPSPSPLSSYPPSSLQHSRPTSAPQGAQFPSTYSRHGDGMRGSVSRGGMRGLCGPG